RRSPVAPHRLPGALPIRPAWRAAPLMTRAFSILATPAFGLVLASTRVVAHAPASGPEARRFFEEHIRPVLAEKCYSCHSAESEADRKCTRLNSSPVNSSY